MTVETYVDTIEFDRTLTEGMLVSVNWTNSGRYFGATGRVSKLNDKSVRVKLLMATRPYPQGFEVTVPRPRRGTRWSINNTVLPAASPVL